MKRYLKLTAIILAILMVIPMSAIPASAAGKYGKVPILIGNPEVDYEAEQILSKISTEGKSGIQQLQAVYDWIIYHCTRYEDEWDGTYHYDQQAVQSRLTSYSNNVEQKIYQGKAVLRQELEPYFDVDDSWDGYTGYSIDANDSIAYLAKEMMLKRNGDCVKFSALFTVLAGHLGYDCHIIPGQYINPNGSKVSHKWNYILIDGKYYWFDIRIDHSFYTKKGKLQHDYFMIADTKAWEKTHEWNHAYSNILASNAAAVTELYNQAIRSAGDEAPYEEVDTSDGSLYNYWIMNNYVPGQFKDVKESAWYAENVKNAFEYGLLLGNDNGSFGVGDNLTVAQTLAIAARLHNRYYGGSGKFYQGDPWYQVYTDYALKYGIISQGQYNPSATATRAQFAQILSDALPDEALPAINEITAIPDVNPSATYADSVYRLYNAGILTGNDEAGTFGPETPVKREQVAAMATRFANQDLRKQFTLKPAGLNPVLEEDIVDDRGYSR